MFEFVLVGLCRGFRVSVEVFITVVKWTELLLSFMGINTLLRKIVDRDVTVVLNGKIKNFCFEKQCSLLLSVVAYFAGFF